MKTTLAIVCALLLLPILVSAQDDWVVNPRGIEWDPVLEADVVGYNIYQASSEDGMIWGYPWRSVNTTEYMFQDHASGDYYWRVTAVDEAGNESEFSDPCHARFIVDLPPPPPTSGCSILP